MNEFVTGDKLETGDLIILTRNRWELQVLETWVSRHDSINVLTDDGVTRTFPDNFCIERITAI